MIIDFGEAVRYGLGLMVYILAIGIAAGALGVVGVAFFGAGLGAGAGGEGGVAVGGAIGALVGGVMVVAAYVLFVAGMLGMQYKVAAEGSARALEEAGAGSPGGPAGEAGRAVEGGRGSEARVGSGSDRGREGEF